MDKPYNILAINPGSTSTKVAVFQNEIQVFSRVVRHEISELSEFETIIDQYHFRKGVILQILKDNNINLEELDAVVGRGGLMKPIQSGTYKIDEAMLKDLKSSAFGQHASSLGGVIAYEISMEINKPGFIVDPVVVDEMEPLAKFSGMPGINRKSLFHALNQKAVAKRCARDLKKSYSDINLIVAHMGGGISVGAHKNGRVIDVNNALDGDGPFSPERTGGVPIGDIVNLCFSGQYSQEEIMKKIVGNGGLKAYLGTNDGREVKYRIKKGDDYAKDVYMAMAYQIAKEIGSMAAVLHGNVDAILITGGLAYDDRFTGWIVERVSFIAPIIIYPGEDEMVALAEGALRVLTGEEKVKEYGEQ